MRGEDLQGLGIEELLSLEKALETGLSRVLEKKVWTCNSSAFTICRFGFMFKFWTLSFVELFQSEQIMAQINGLRQKVRNKMFKFRCGASYKNEMTSALLRWQGDRLVIKRIQTFMWLESLLELWCLKSEFVFLSR